MKKIKINREYLFYLFISFFISVWLSGWIIENPDLGWHLSAGRFIIENLKIPAYDFLSWTKNSTEWVNFEWLTQVFYYLIYRFFGYEGLYVLKIVNIFLIYVSFSLMFKLFKINWFNLVWILPLYLITVINLSDLRPDNYSVMFFSLLLYSLEKLRNNEFKFKDTAYIAFMFVLWANIHAGFIYGLILILIYFAGELFNENLDFIYGKYNAFTVCRSKKYLYLFAIALLAGFINPSGYKIYSVFLIHSKELSHYQQYIKEWFVMDITENFGYLVFYIISFFTLFTYLYLFLKRKIEFDMTKVFMLLFFLPVAVLHQRLVIFGSFVSIFVLMYIFREKLNSIYFKLSGAVFFVICFSFIIKSERLFSYQNYPFNGNYYRMYLRDDSLIEFMKKNKDVFKKHKVYNTYNMGGYLGWELYGDFKVFMDGRYIFTDMIKEHLYANTYRKNWEDFIKKYDFDYAIYPLSEIFFIRFDYPYRKEKREIIRPFYVNNIDFRLWRIVYFDKAVMIIVRSDRFDKRFVNKYAYKYLKPYDADFLRYYITVHPEKKKEIKKEIIRYLRENAENKLSFCDDYLFFMKNNKI